MTAKGQTTIPKEIRLALQIKPGDLLLWDNAGNGVARIRRVQPADNDYLSALEGTLGEWSTQEDDEAYRGF